MPKIVEITKLDEKCPKCDSQLVDIVEQWNPFSDEEDPSNIRAKSCGECSYELVIEDKLFYPKKVPYVRQRDGNYFTVKCVEQVYDEFNDFEHEKECEPITIIAISIEEAITRGEKIAQHKVEEYRKESDDASKGMFIAKVVEVLDVYGNELYNTNRELVNSNN